MGMGRRYSVAQQDTNTAATSMIGITATAAVRPRIYDLLMSSGGTPADNGVLYLLERHTLPGTNTAFTPVALDPGDPASLTTGGYNHTVEPTYTANSFLLRICHNMRATVRFPAAPDGEIVLPATANSGASLLSSAVSTAFLDDFTLHFCQ